MKIGEYLESVNQQPVSCLRTDSVQDAATKLSVNGIGAMPVLSKDGMLVGMLSERDIVREISKRGEDFFSLKVEDILSESVIFTGPNADLSEAMRVMNKHGFRHLPVLSDGRLLGVISIRDLLALSTPHDGPVADHPVLAVVTG